MSLDAEYLNVAFEINVDGEIKRIEVDGISILPRIGESVECNYVHGTKAFFEVTEVNHHLSNIGHNILQQITIRGGVV